MDKLKKWWADLRWAIFEHNPSGKMCLLGKKGQKLYLRPEIHYRLTGEDTNIRLDYREDVEEFCRRFDFKLLG